MQTYNFFLLCNKIFIMCICICTYGVCMCARTCVPWLICGGHRKSQMWSLLPFYLRQCPCLLQCVPGYLGHEFYDFLKNVARSPVADMIF